MAILDPGMRLRIQEHEHVADPEPDSFLTFGSFFDPGSGMGKNSGSGSGMNYPDHIS
jgi:hypothetical protein